MTSLPVTCFRRTRPHNFHDPFPRVAYRPHTYIVFRTDLTTTLFVSPCWPRSTNTMGKLSLTDTDGIFWNSPSEGPLSRPFTNYTHNTSYRPNARGGPSSYFSQSPELCVATSKYLSSPVIDYRAQRYLSLSWSVLCFYLGT